MRTRLLYLLSFLLLFFVSLSDLPGQNNRRSKRAAREQAEQWPPERAYSRLSLGNALQQVFRKHYDFCGFPEVKGYRDFTPPTLERFLGRRNLRTRVEQADVSGGNLLNYIFSEAERYLPLDEIAFRQQQLLFLSGEPAGFQPQPREGFDAFVMTRNCSGYLKACLDAGIKPPYAAFSTALDTDAERKSSVLTVAGSFSSPLNDLLLRRDDRTTELMARLWEFYEAHPEFNGRAYYLTEFDGMLVRHLSEAASVFRAERSLGVNVSLPFAAQLNAATERANSSELTFAGTDWETIVYTDFAGDYQRERLFRPLPTVAEIAAYFAGLRPTFAAERHATAFTENALHRHELQLPGLPASLARAAWTITQLSPGLYQGRPDISQRFYDKDDGTFGATFAVSGVPDPRLFRQPAGVRSGVAALQYVLTLKGKYGTDLQLPVRQELPTSMHPVLQLVSADFDLSKRDNQQFAFEWEVELQLLDTDNPVDLAAPAYLDKLALRRASGEMAVEVIDVHFNTARHSLTMKLASRENWPLSRINDRKMVDYNLTGEVHLPIQRGVANTPRPLSLVVAVPTIEPEAAPQLPEAVVPNGEKSAPAPALESKQGDY